MNQAPHPNFSSAEAEIADDLAPYAAEPILGMPTYEGEVGITHVTDAGAEAILPLRVRIVLGPGLKLPDRSYYGEGRQNPDPISALFFHAGQIVGLRSRALIDGEHGDQTTNQAYRLMLEAASEGAAPVTVVWAHGNNVQGRQAIQTQPNTGYWLDEVIDAIQRQDIQSGSGTRASSTILLASCNPEGNKLGHEGTTLIYRAGLAGYMATSQLTISRTPERKHWLRWLPF